VKVLHVSLFLRQAIALAAKRQTRLKFVQELHEPKMSPEYAAFEFRLAKPHSGSANVLY
jgi:hypothetical protein